MNARRFPWFGCCSLMMAGAITLVAQEPDRPPQVAVAQPVVRMVTDYEVFSGRAEAVQRIDLRCRVSGYLVKTLFQEGSDVKQGDLLFEIDQRPYRVELERADASLSLAESRLRFAETNYKRAATLQARGALSQEELGKIAAERVEAEAAIRVARSGREAATLNLEYTRVLAPIAGRIGQRLIDPGNLVKADETRLAVLVSRDPIHVTFNVDERTLLRLMRSMRNAGGKFEKVEVDIALSDDNGFPHRGLLDFVDNQVDPATGSLRMRAVVANKDGLLTPGMFARMRLALGSPYEAILVPVRAIMVEEGEPFVFVVDDNDVIGRRPVKLGRQHDGLRAVDAGLKAKERVAIGGIGRLRPGMVVQPRPEAQPEKKSADVPDDPAWSTPPLPRGSSGPGILVEAVYPGASAEATSDSVRGPIEQMVGGVEGLRYMRSRCSSDGKLTVALTFQRGVDLQRVQGLTQNRFTLALPLLPDVVKHAGPRITQASAGVPVIVNLVSPDSKFDQLFLGNYASIQLRDELTRVVGVGEVQLIGHSPYAVRVWLDPAKLAERQLNAGEVSQLLAKEEDPVRGDREQLANLILKADDEGRVIRLRDVARVEMGVGGRGSEALLDGKPGVTLVIYPTAQVNANSMRGALHKRLAELRDRLPEGLALEEKFDFTANAEYLLLDVDVPHVAVAGSTRNLLNRCHELLRQVHGVEHVLALSGNPFDLFGSGPCVLVRLTPAEQRKTARENVIDSIRARLAVLEEATVRVRTLSHPSGFPALGYPVDLALDGPEASRVRDWASALGERLVRSKKVTDVWVNRDANPRAHQFAEVDREAAAMRGVSLKDILNTLQVTLGAEHVGNSHVFGRNWRVEVQADTGAGDLATALRQLKVRSSRGQMIPLDTVVKLRESTQPLALHFLDGRPMVEMTANPAAGVPLEQARKLCEKAAAEARNDLSLGAGYRLTWLRDK